MSADVAALIAAHGSPLWLADLDRVRERLARVRAAWDGRSGPTSSVAYSYKTNRLPAILQTVADEGAAPRSCAPPSTRWRAT